MEEEQKENLISAEQEETKVNDFNGENLSDRVKTLSPGRTVAKRFFRSKLSVIGLVILITLFIISFFGPLFSPWGEQQVDRSEKVIVNVEETRYETADGQIVTGYEITVEVNDVNKIGRAHV